MQPNRLQRDLERELAFHIAEQTEEQRELGLSETDAARTARLRFGNFTGYLERTREMDINLVLEALVRNVRFGVRALAKTPAFTATVVLTLALGIGANSAVFSAIYAVLLRPLPYPHASELVKLTQSQPKIPDGFVAPVRLEEWNRLNTTLQGITGYYVEDASETSGELPEKLKRAWVAPRFLEVMGIAPELGRDFSPQEMRYGGPVAVLISHRLWQRRFGGNVNVLGQKLRIAPSSFVIVGVMPPWLRFPDGDVDLWSTTPPDAQYAQNRENTWYTGIGRMKPGVSLGRSARQPDCGPSRSRPAVSKDRRHEGDGPFQSLCPGCTGPRGYPYPRRRGVFPGSTDGDCQIHRTAGKSEEDLNQAIRQIVSRAITAEGVVDLFSAAGLKKPDAVFALERHEN